MIERRVLGTTGLRIAPLVLGGNVFGWTADEQTSFEVLDAFVSAGFNTIDTADVYSSWVAGHVGGESETILGRWLRSSGRRSEVLLATKVGMDTATSTGGLSRRHVLASIAGSLRRLGTETIDLYQAHTDDPQTPLAETLGTFQELLHDGRVRSIGASNYSAGRLREAAQVCAAHEWRPFGSLQPRYNLYDRTDFEQNLSSICRELGLGVITYASLASGFLSGKYRTPADLGKSPRSYRAKEKLTPRGERILSALDTVSRDRSTAPASVAIAWLLTRPEVTAPIASATSRAQLDELVAGTQLRLTRDDVRVLDEASREPAAPPG